MQNIFDRMLNNKVVKLIIKVLHDRFRAACVDTRETQAKIQSGPRG